MKHPREIYAESEGELRKSLENPAMDIRERELRTNALLVKKLDLIEKPHWTQVPSFWAALVAAIAGLGALYYAANPPAPQSAATSQKAGSESTTSQKPSPQSTEKSQP